MNNAFFHRLKRPIMAAFIGAATTLAFAPFSVWPIAIISPAFLLLLLKDRSPKHAFAIGYAWGFGQFATGISWVYVSIANFGGMPWIANIFLMALLIGYLALYSGLFAYLMQKFTPQTGRVRLLLAAPALWLVCDWLRGWVMTGFPWLWLGYSQINSPMAWFAPLGGVELITLLVLFCSGACALAWQRKQWPLALLPLVILATGFGLKSVDWVTPQPQSATQFSLIQGNIDQKLKWAPHHRWPTIMKYTHLTEENWSSDIIIWPEAAIPAFEDELPSFLTRLDEVAKQSDAAIITGIVNRDSEGDYYNSILALGQTPYGDYHFDLTKRYNKHHLLPFGEFVPFQDWLRPIAPFFNLPMSSFQRGDYIQPNLIAKGRHFVSALCYEIIFGEQVRQNVTGQTDFLLTLSNDAWFGHSIGPLQHMEIAQMRALELGKPLIRATNNGVTAVTDYRGQIIQALPQFETGVLTQTLTPTTGNTPYRVVGSWPLYLFVSLACLWLGSRQYLIRRQAKQ